VVGPHVPYDVQDVDADFKRLAWRLGGAGECTRNYSGSPISNVQTSEPSASMVAVMRFGEVAERGIAQASAWKNAPPGAQTQSLDRDNAEPCEVAG
jgi:hypothetical protein